ncbi:hypothetical protein F5883DRAFT_657150 [Diaporthe sp. PMI_573]|nr:hypothetical protein F5883DRAFT_657150 [Diaporthaceae sp. PMI_573]
MLPLDLPLKALECLRRNTLVQRGTLQTKWVLKQLNECQRLGLGNEWLTRLKEHKVTFAVCAEVVLPEGSADGKVETGDILLELNGKLATSLLQVEQHMDAHVNDSVTLTCWTANGLRHIECDIEDLHALTPHHLVRRHGAVFHAVCFTTAIHNNIAARGIFTACGAQRAFAGKHIIELINGKSITTLEQLIQEIDDNRHEDFITTFHKELTHHGRSLPTTGYQIRAIGNVSFEMKRQPQQGGRWVTTYMRSPTSVLSLPPRPCLRDPLQRGQLCEAAADEVSVPDTGTPPAVKDAYRAIVSFEAHRDIFSNSQFISRIAGHGLIWDTKAGFVLAARGKLTMIDEIVMTVAGTTDVKARVDFLHPALDLAVLKFDPADLPEGLLHACPLAAMEDPIQPGVQVYYVPFDLFNKTIILDYKKA